MFRCLTMYIVGLGGAVGTRSPHLPPTLYTAHTKSSITAY